MVLSVQWPDHQGFETTLNFCLTIYPNKKFGPEFTELLSVKIYYATSDRVCLGNPKQCIMGYS